MMTIRVMVCRKKKKLSSSFRIKLSQVRIRCVSVFACLLALIELIC